MKDVKEGVKVNILFEARLESGETVLKTEEKQPLEVVVGEGAIPKTIEQSLIDMKVGETKTITLEPVEAFGPKINDLIIELPKEGFNPGVTLEVGSRVSIKSPEGKTFIGTILDVQDDKVSVDFNHPLAGKSLIFVVTVVSIL